MNTTVSHETGDLRHGFSVGPWHLLVPSGIPAYLLDEFAISPLPFTPAWFTGIANHRGDVVPVFALPSLVIGSPPPASQRHWLLVLDQRPAMFGLLLDNCPQPLTALQAVDANTAVPMPAPVQPFVHHAYFGNGHYWLDCHYGHWLKSLKNQFWQ